MSTSALYAFVVDCTNNHTDFNHWLQTVAKYGGKSPLIIVLNEKNKRKRDINIDFLKKRCSNIAEVIDVDFAEQSKFRLENLKRAIRYHIASLPQVGCPVPSKWILIRETLENLTQNSISLLEYINICQRYGITKAQDALVLSQYLHDLGVILHYQDNSLLKKTIFLTAT